MISKQKRGGDANTAPVRPALPAAFLVNQTLLKTVVRGADGDVPTGTSDRASARDCFACPFICVCSIRFPLETNNVDLQRRPDRQVLNKSRLLSQNLEKNAIMFGFQEIRLTRFWSFATLGLLAERLRESPLSWLGRPNSYAEYFSQVHDLAAPLKVTDLVSVDFPWREFKSQRFWRFYLEKTYDYREFQDKKPSNA